MNMRLPRYLRDSDPALSNVPINETPVEIADVEYEWMTEELENVERQVEHELWEEAFIEACFEEMLAEEEAQWHHFTYLTAPNIGPLAVPFSGPIAVPQLPSTASPFWQPCNGVPLEAHGQLTIVPDMSPVDNRYTQGTSESGKQRRDTFFGILMAVQDPTTETIIDMCEKNIGPNRPKT